MKKHILPFILAILVLLSAASLRAQPSPGLPSPVPEDCALVTHTHYASMYDPALGIPRWVTYELTPGMVTTDGVSRNGEEFVPDPLIPGCPESRDYSRNGLSMDRGHLMPAADCRFSALAMGESFYLGANVCPQEHSLNEGPWCDLEKQVRFWCKHFYKCSLTVVCGTVAGEGCRTIGNGRVAVPSHLWKAVLRLDPRSGRWTAAGFLFPNDGSTQDWRTRLVSVDEIEALTGLDLFPDLPQSVQKEIESGKNTEEWKF